MGKRLAKASPSSETYSFTLNRKTAHMEKWLKQLKENKQLPAVVRMGLIMVERLQGMGCPIPEDDPAKLEIYLSTWLSGLSVPQARTSSPTMTLNLHAESAKMVHETASTSEDPEKNVMDFLKGV